METTSLCLWWVELLLHSAPFMFPVIISLTLMGSGGVGKTGSAAFTSAPPRFSAAVAAFGGLGCCFGAPHGTGHFTAIGGFDGSGHERLGSNAFATILRA
jgi:hypothetical protein